MKINRILSVLILLSLFIKTHAQITDDFTDGDFTSNPTWTLNTSGDFTVVASQLKSANTTSNSAFYISTASSLANNCQWEFYVNLQFNTSGTNYVDVYLTSDVTNLLSTSINGYFVRIGNTLDEICLYKRSGTLGTAVKIIDGADGITNLSNNTLKIKVVRNSSNVFSLERDITGTGNNYVSEGTTTDATFTTSNSFGFYITQSTASFTQKHVFDDIVVGPVILDLTAPILVSATPTSSTSVDVLFNENVDIASSQTAPNYTLNPGIGTAATASRDAGNFKLVHLSLSTPLVSGNTYTLSVNAVQDVAGNAISTSTTTFNYMVYGTPAFKDLVINEIYADPSPLVNLTATEFVEIYNRSTNPFNLNGLKLTDNGSIATLPNYIMLPNAYVIICPITDTAQFTALGYMNKLGVNAFPSLNNASDNIYLKTASNAVIDSVNYQDSWYGDAIKKDGGYTLEQINPNQGANCSQANNWLGSTDVDGGTPGFINSVYSIAADVTGPKVSLVTVIDSLHISVCFNDVIATAQLNTPANYMVSNGIGIPTLAVAINGNFCVDLSLASKLVNATNYTVTLNGITDCNGNVISPNTGTFSYYKHKPYDVVMNELMPDPDPAINLPLEEYVELKNRTAYTINLKDWSFSTPTVSKKLPAIHIKPDSFIVLTGTGNALAFSAFGITAYEVTSLPSLPNGGTTLTLRDSNHVVIHSISYTSDWYNNANKSDGGWSMEQVDANNPCGGQSNWKASSNANGGTPGKKNSVAAANADNQVPELERIVVMDADTILLLFSEPLDSSSLAGSMVYTFDNGLGQPSSVMPIGTDYRKVKLKLSTAIQQGIIYHCTLSDGIRDCAGNVIAPGNAIPFALPEAPLPNDIIINEVLSEPGTGGVDYVELYNKSGKTVDLKDLQIGSLDTLTNTLKDLENISEEGYLLFPETYIVLSENGTVVKANYQTINPKGFLDMPDLPTLNSDADVVTLSDKAGLIIDNFIYNSKMHFPLLISTKGVSLERIDFNRPTNDKTNWNSASERVGFGTPAYLNSQYMQADGGNGVNISNPLFSPDNDGYNDVLNITYKLDEPGKAANVYIYDSKGRQVRYLIRNEQLMQDGTFSWNGINDDNEKAAIGIYVVYVELFNFSGKVNKYKLSCTLAGKL
ncbi:MAG: lamin tail domain-containing protein [Bacteroidota bacterium]